MIKNNQPSVLFKQLAGCCFGNNGEAIETYVILKFSVQFEKNR
ncbi:Uncharacterised protein [Alloiococcus otitis]|nr:Uncharacterised protein [Alloiococcus otitis]